MWAQRRASGLWDTTAGGEPWTSSEGAQVVPWVSPGLSHFHRHPKSVEVEQGAVARLQCLIRWVPEPSISWEHNGLALRTADHR